MLCLTLRGMWRTLMINWVLNLIGAGLSAVARLAAFAVFLAALIWGGLALLVSIPMGIIIIVVGVFVSAVIFRFADVIE